MGLVRITAIDDCCCLRSVLLLLFVSIGVVDSLFDIDDDPFVGISSSSFSGRFDGAGVIGLINAFLRHLDS
jgi:hypothetical protein